MENNADRGKEGRVRTLTIGEVALASSIYGDKINYYRVRINKRSYLPFGLQNKRVAMTPNGEIYFRDELYSEDYSLEKGSAQHLFIHEMGHVMQYQQGMYVKLRGLFSWAVDYQYVLEKGKKLTSYGMEQQASIMADYFYIKKYGTHAFSEFSGRNIFGLIDEDTIYKFKELFSYSGVQ